MKTKFPSLVFVVFLIFLAKEVFAYQPFDVVINEIAWMGTEASFNNEWIELYNTTSSPLNLEGWVLKWADGALEINLTGIISQNSFYLLERTDDNTLPEIKADLVYRGTLRNKGEKLELFDNFANLIDEVDCSSGWFAGDQKKKQTMERKNPKVLGSDPLNWQKSKNPGGTPKEKNSQLTESELQTKESSYPSGILINEILPSPNGKDETEEWIEIYNQNNFEVDLSNWQITDRKGKTRSYFFPQETKISPKGFLVLSRTITKITLNNKGDGLKLLKPDGTISDEITYEKAPNGQSYNRTKSGWSWSIFLTPGKENIIQKPEIEEKETNSLQAKNSENPSNLLKESLATIEKTRELESTHSSNFLVILGTGLVFAFFSGIICLILKKKLLKLKKI